MPIVANPAFAIRKRPEFVASVLQRSSVTPIQEFADLLALFAESFAETVPGEADILRTWAASMWSARTH